jgi:hypothetical protein
MSENHKILQYMDNVFNKIIKTPNNLNVIVVSKANKCFRTNILSAEKAKFTYSNVATFSDKVNLIMAKLFKDDPVECIRLKGSKKGEIFMTFDEHLDIIVIDKNCGR